MIKKVSGRTEPRNKVKSGPGVTGRNTLVSFMQRNVKCLLYWINLYVAYQIILILNLKILEYM